VGFPTLGELVDLQRNMEVFPQAGATETVLPPNGRIQYPKLTNATTAYFLGEGQTGTSSTPTTGYLDLVAKKLFVLTYLNNELLKFNTISAEAMLRLDMARVGAIRADLAMLQGVGGTEVLGLINYPTQTAPWTFGNDNLIAYTVTSNRFGANDPAGMVEALPDPVQDPTAWIMRRDMWNYIINRRSDVLTTNDGLGQFLFWTARGHASERPPYELYDVPVIRSAQVSNTRSTSKTYIIVGFFPDWVIGRSGVMEFLASPYSDTAMTNDQTLLRGIQYIDAGARHAASFTFADNVNLS
jgi:HK97 family phage major capsid protein